jgi:Ser/Thr protein kinase RdoA (MazF antagonist)
VNLDAESGARSAIAPIAGAFAIAGTLESARPLGRGHIHATFLADYADGGRRERYVHQRINRRVFPDVRAVVENVGRVVRHLAAKGLATLRLIPTTSGADACCIDGEWWRTFAYVEGASSHAQGDVRSAYASALAFGRFASGLADLPPPPLHDVLPGFHDTPARLRALARAVMDDPAGRVRGAASKIALAYAHEELAGALVGPRAPDSVLHSVHNDAKLDNVLLDDVTGEPRCVIDLDTVMPGLPLFDFGDMVRTGAATAPEDERDLDRVDVDVDRYAALANGYVAGAGDLLDARDRARLPLAARVLALESALRFLTDHLLGDAYFHVDRSGHNLDRARAQFALLARLSAREAELGCCLR